MAARASPAACPPTVACDGDAPTRESLHVAHVNIALPRAPLSSPLLADFVAALEPVNELAERSPGFVWRLQLSDADTVEARGVDDDRLITTLSIWESLESLRAFSYGTQAHWGALRRRREWFVKLARSSYALWWVAPGHEPTVTEAMRRLEHLDEHGPTTFAFTFPHSFPPAPAAERSGARQLSSSAPRPPTSTET